ncbi:hypothetical protein GOQ29_13890 [Clostridium sp. D2Q-14]|uniref:nucleoside-triphosphatase n=1 Tax=Anaeromonas gelatinilytica TaxID=2683194 RepID=UPI00193B8C7F|nr:nucleoside-triphosphatase [Anaeromonas gelatinilytica]MBS4536710.1 hypothetical protein [Anaeromonas gelatinilytica]
MNCKNLFLTGNIKVGKSTIINKVIDEYFKDKTIAGFKTLPFYEYGYLKGYYIENQLEENIFPKKENIVGINSKNYGEKKCFGIAETFENKGVDILNKSIDKNIDLVLLDEIGFFENEASVFKKNVHRVLDSEKRVLGVLKKKDTEFLKGLIARKDVMVIEVTEENRNNIVKQISNYWRL